MGSKRYEWVEIGGGRWSKRERVGDLKHQMEINMVAERHYGPRPGNDTVGGKRSGKGVGLEPRTGNPVDGITVPPGLEGAFPESGLGKDSEGNFGNEGVWGPMKLGIGPQRRVTQGIRRWRRNWAR